MKEKKYLRIVEYYESCFAKYGDTHLGVDWPKAEDVSKRYRVMLELIREAPGVNNRESSGTKVTLLDFGCGAGHLYEHMLREGLNHIEYSGLDLSEKFVALAREKFPGLKFYQADLLEDTSCIPVFDYLVANGVFTERRGLEFDEMLDYFERLLKKAWETTRCGLAFNIMSKHVGWEREDLFHLSFDTLAAFLTRELTRNFVFRNDYGLYEYTAYVYR